MAQRRPCLCCGTPRFGAKKGQASPNTTGRGEIVGRDHGLTTVVTLWCSARSLGGDHRHCRPGPRPRRQGEPGRSHADLTGPLCASRERLPQREPLHSGRGALVLALGPLRLRLRRRDREHRLGPRLARRTVAHHGPGGEHDDVSDEPERPGPALAYGRDPADEADRRRPEAPSSSPSRPRDRSDEGRGREHGATPDRGARLAHREAGISALGPILSQAGRRASPCGDRGGGAVCPGSVSVLMGKSATTMRGWPILEQELEPISSANSRSICTGLARPNRQNRHVFL